MDSIATYLNSVAIEIYSVETEFKSPVTEINPFTTDKLSDKHLACHLKTLYIIFQNAWLSCFLYVPLLAIVVLKLITAISITGFYRIRESPLCKRSSFESLIFLFPSLS